MENQTALEMALALIDDGTLSVDENGFVWRNAILSHGKRVPIQPRRAESEGGKGYLRLMLQIDGRLRGVGAHRVVYTHFCGPIPDGMQINHIDLNKRNNSPSNLEAVTGAENMQHSYAAGPRVRPWSYATSWRGKHMLTQSEIAEAKSLRSSGALIREIASRYGISITHAHRITS